MRDSDVKDKIRSLERECLALVGQDDMDNRLISNAAMIAVFFPVGQQALNGSLVLAAAVTKGLDKETAHKLLDLMIKAVASGDSINGRVLEDGPCLN